MKFKAPHAGVPRRKKDETEQEYQRRYWYMVTKPKLLKEREKQQEVLAARLGLEIGYDPVIEMMEEHKACQQILDELEPYALMGRPHHLYQTRESLLDVITEVRAKKYAVAKELLPYFHHRLSSGDQRVTIDDVRHNISDEPMSDDEWTDNYCGVAPTNGASKDSH